MPVFRHDVIGSTPLIGATTGSLIFAGANSVFQQDNANLFWDDTNNRLGIGTASPSDPLTIIHALSSDVSSNALKITATPTLGTIAANRTIIGNNTANTPTAVVSGTRNLTSYATSNVLDLSNVSIGSSGANNVITGYGMQYGISGTIVINNANTGQGIGTAGVFGSNTSNLSITSIGGSSTYFTYGGAFQNQATSPGSSNLTSTAYGIYVTATGDLTTTGATTHYGGYFTTAGTADTNFGIYVIASGATANTAALIGYDASNYMTITSSSSGAITFDAVGSSAGFTFSDTVTLSGFTAGSALFAGTSGIISQDNTNFFWDDSNNRLGIGTNSPNSLVHIVGSLAGSYGLRVSNTSATGVGIKIDTTAGSTDILGTNSTWLIDIAGVGNFTRLNATNPSALLNQLLIGYDGSNYFDVTVGATGTATFDAHGSGAGFTFNDAVTLSTPLAKGSGGTGQSTYTNGQLLIGNTTGNTLTKATLTGTANQIIVTNGAGTITLTTPQDIATTSNPTFTNMTINDLVFTVGAMDSAKNISTSTNTGAVRMYATNSLTSTPDGAALQFWGNGSSLTGQAYIDSGAHNSASINFRTAQTSGTITTRMIISATGAVRMNIYGAGAATFDASGNITSVSDERLKDIQGFFNPGLKEILSISPILFKYNKQSGLDRENIYAGFSAQNVMKYIPEAVGKGNDGLYSFNDRPVIAALVNAVKQLQQQIDGLKSQANLPLDDLSIDPLLNEERIIVSALV